VASGCFKKACLPLTYEIHLFLESILASRRTDIEKASLCVTIQCNVPSCDHDCALVCVPAVNLAVFMHPQEERGTFHGSPR
jgi:hypothetical protein